MNTLKQRIVKLENSAKSRERKLFTLDAADFPDVDNEAKRLRAAFPNAKILIIEDSEV